MKVKARWIFAILLTSIYFVSCQSTGDSVIDPPPVKSSSDYLAINLDTSGNLIATQNYRLFVLKNQEDTSHVYGGITLCDYSITTAREGGNTSATAYFSATDSIEGRVTNLYSYRQRKTVFEDSFSDHELVSPEKLIGFYQADTFAGLGITLPCDSAPEIDLKGVHADMVIIRQNSTLNLKLLACEIENLLLVSDYDYASAMFVGARYSSNGFPLRVHTPDFHNFPSRIPNIFIKNKVIDDLDLGNCAAKKICISGCTVNENVSVMSTFAPDTIVLENIHFANDTARLRLNFDIVEKKIVLLTTCDFSKLDIDYENFLFVPFPANSLEYGGLDKSKYLASVYSLYSGLILSQTKDFYIFGKRDAEIDFEKFKDRQYSLGSFLVAVKTWWNNYGYNKERILLASLKLYVFFFFVNLLCFRKLAGDVYEVKEIDRALKNLDERPNSKVKRLQRSVLCLLYTGYIFFGIKLDIEKLKITNVFLTLLVLLQYTMGLISMGYVANYIVTK